jgi:thioredoxin 1
MKALLRFAFCALLSLTAGAAQPPYDEKADPRADLQHALSEARDQHKDVLIIFGANWCEDCRDLDRSMRGSSAALIGSRFVVVKVDVGNFNKHLDLARQYGDPIRNGIPAAVVVSAADRVLYTTKAGELANARRMGDSGVYDFFSKVIAAHIADRA